MEGASVTCSHLLESSFVALLIRSACLWFPSPGWGVSWQTPWGSLPRCPRPLAHSAGSWRCWALWGISGILMVAQHQFLPGYSKLLPSYSQELILASESQFACPLWFFNLLNKVCTGFFWMPLWGGAFWTKAWMSLHVNEFWGKQERSAKLAVS